MKQSKVILIVVISAVAVVAITSLFIFTPFKNIFKGEPVWPSLDLAIQSGKIEILSEREASSFFTFVSVEEAKKMLADAEASGQFKFLMPQFDIPEGGLKGVLIKNEDTLTDIGMVRFLSISGLLGGTTIYANSDKFGQGGTTSGDDAFSWFRTRNMGDPIEGVIYVPAYLSLAKAQEVFLLKSEDFFVEVPLGTPIFKLESNLYLDNEFLPENTEIAYRITDGENNNLADLKNVLVKNGKIVMVKR